MKADISHDGKLIVSAETDMERFALRKWYDQWRTPSKPCLFFSFEDDPMFQRMEGPKLTAVESLFPFHKSSHLENTYETESARNAVEIEEDLVIIREAKHYERLLTLERWQAEELHRLLGWMLEKF